MSEDKLSRIELLALIKIHNKLNNDKIKNIDKLKKEELLDICKKHGLLSGHNSIEKIDLYNINKKHLLQDVEIWYMKQNKSIPLDVQQMKKKDLIDFMELNNIEHYTVDKIELEINKYNKLNNMRNIIIYNIIKYDNIDVNNIDNEDLESFIIEHNLDTNIKNMDQYAKLLHNLYVCCEEYCKSIQIPFEYDKIRTFPKIMKHLNNII